MLAATLVLATLAAPGDLRLMGLVVSGAPDRCVAVLRSAGKTRVVSPGESAFGGRLLAVGPRGASLDFEGVRVDLALSTAPVPVAAAAPPPVREAAAAEDTSGAPRSLDKREVERRLTLEIPRILAETTAVPVMENGRVTGIALTRIAEGSLLTEAGLRAGDVLTQINDTVIDGLPTLIGLYPRLQSARELHATVLRNGVPVSISVNLK
jgi:type II secretion system protein C